MPRHTNAGRKHNPSGPAISKQARLRCDRIFDDLWDNTDDEGHKLARGVLDGKFQWLEAGILDPSGDGPIVKPVG